MRQIPGKAWRWSETLPLIHLFVPFPSVRPRQLCEALTPWQLGWYESIPQINALTLSSGDNKMWADYNFISANWPHCEPTAQLLWHGNEELSVWVLGSVPSSATHRECQRSPWRYQNVAAGHAKGQRLGYLATSRNELYPVAYVK